MKKIFVILAAVLVLGSVFMIPAFAMTQYRVNMYDVSGDYFSGIYFKSDTDSVWSNGFITNETYVGTFEFSLDFKVVVLDPDTYTGCFLRISSSIGGQDLTSGLVNIEPDEWGNIYCATGTAYSIYLTVYPPTEYFIECIPINYPEYVSSQGGYIAGYRDGQAAGYSNCYNNLYLPLLDQYQALQDQISQQGGVDVAALQRIAGEAGFEEGVASSNIIPNLFKSIFNAVGRFFGMILSFKFLGIPVYSILLIFALIPITIKIVKLCMHGGG